MLFFIRHRERGISLLLTRMPPLCLPISTYSEWWTKNTLFPRWRLRVSTFIQFRFYFGSTFASTSVLIVSILTSYSMILYEDMIFLHIPFLIPINILVNILRYVDSTICYLSCMMVFDSICLTFFCLFEGQKSPQIRLLPLFLGITNEQFEWTMLKPATDYSRNVTKMRKICEKRESHEKKKVHTRITWKSSKTFHDSIIFSYNCFIICRTRKSVCLVHNYRFYREMVREVRHEKSVSWSSVKNTK